MNNTTTTIIVSSAMMEFVFKIGMVMANISTTRRKRLALVVNFIFPLVQLAVLPLFANWRVVLMTLVPSMMILSMVWRAFSGGLQQFQKNFVADEQRHLMQIVKSVVSAILPAFMWLIYFAVLAHLSAPKAVMDKQLWLLGYCAFISRVCKDAASNQGNLTFYFDCFQDEKELLDSEYLEFYFDTVERDDGEFILGSYFYE